MHYTLADKFINIYDKSPAEMIFAYEVWHPLIDYNIGQVFMYKKTPASAAEQVEFLIQNSKRTVYVQKEDGDVVLAHVDQLQTVPVEEDGQDSEVAVHDSVGEDGVGMHKDEEVVNGSPSSTGVPILWYPMHEHKPPVHFMEEGYY